MMCVFCILQIKEQGRRYTLWEKDAKHKNKPITEHVQNVEQLCLHLKIPELSCESASYDKTLFFGSFIKYENQRWLMLGVDQQMN